MAPNDVDMKLLTVLLHFATEALALIEREEQSMLQAHIREQRKMCRSLPAEKTRPTWIGFCNHVSDRHFRRQFRMNRNAFTNMCTKFITAVGESTFRPKNIVLSTRNAASLQSRGGLIPGEIKAALSIRVLAGGSYLDLAPLFDVSSSHIYLIFDEFLDWVLKAFTFPLTCCIQEEDWIVLSAIAEPFLYGSNGVFAGIIGPLDGLALRIRSPKLTEVSDPGNYYCRKGFFALNVQAIYDRWKKFLWCHTSNKGSTHDSVAFTNSRLYSLLTAKAELLEEKGFYLIGDSAYSLTPFLLVPFSTDEIRNDSSAMCDAYNFYLSSSRIQIECAFGEPVRRWGILWKTLNFDLVKCQRIIQACMLLHNHIKDEEGQIDYSEDTEWIPQDNVPTGTEGAFPLVADNNEPYMGGRPTQSQEVLRARGEAIRRSMTVLLQLQGMRRPLYSGMRYNEYGHVFFDG